jgi:hypothetical protein
MDAGVAFGRKTPLFQGRPERFFALWVLADAPNAKIVVSVRPTAAIPAPTAAIRPRWARANDTRDAGVSPRAVAVLPGFLLIIMALPSFGHSCYLITTLRDLLFGSQSRNPSIELGIFPR